MDKSQRKRLVLLSASGSICAGLLICLPEYLMNYGTTALPLERDTISLGLFGWLGTFISIQFMWRLMLRRKIETKRRGLKYGALAGLLALFLMMTSFTYYHAFHSTVKMGILETLVLSPIMMTMVGFIFFGFIAPIFGAVLGYHFTHNPDG